MPVNRAYLRVTAHTLAAACAIACGGRASLSAIAVDSDGGGAPRGDTSADAAADAELPDGAGYLPDLGPQSAAYQINAAHTGSTDDASLFGAPSRRWAHDFGGPVAFPLIAHGKVIATFITGERPADKRVSVQAFDALTGASVWGPIDLGVSDTASSAYDGGRVFTLDRAGLMHALDVDTGAVLWTAQLGTVAASEQFLGAPTAFGGRVYILPNNYGKAAAVDEMTGRVAWKGARSGGSASPAVTDSAVFVAVGCRNAYRLDRATGATVWHIEAGCSASPGTPVVVDETVFLFSESTLHWADARTGAVSTTATGATLPPAMHGGVGFIPVNGRLHALSLPPVTGGVSWQYLPARGTPFIRTSPMVAGGHVHVLWDDCTLRAFDATTGDPVWSDSEPSACTGPVISGGGPVAMAAAAGTIAVPYRRHLVVYGLASADAGTGTVSDAGTD